MIIIENTKEFNIPENTVAVIGKFDGFHCGHQKLMSTAVECKKNGLAVAVFTFVPSPAVFFSKGEMKEITSTVEKRHFLEQAGVDYLIEFPFDQETADMEPEVYIEEVLVKRMHAKCVVAGDDVSFGKKGAGDYRLLQEKAEEFGYEVKLIEKVEYEHKEISSTFVREEITKGNMELVTHLLGTPFCVAGEIVHGRKLGRTIGMPTVNLIPTGDKILPPKGVYYSYVIYEGKKLPSITNIGVKPTVENEHVMGVETYIYHFDQEIYGEKLAVYLLKFKRPEMKFSSVDELKAQMSADLAAGREFHGLI